MARAATIERTTRETKILLELTLDGEGQSNLATGVGFLDHMLELFAKHGLFDLTVSCEGDLHVDAHHTTEDIGICLGQALDRALGDRAGITRYGHAILPMDETLATVAVDLGGRPYLSWRANIPAPRVGEFDTELVEEFWRAVSLHARLNLHILVHHGTNAHHVIEAIFKGAARAIRQAAAIDPRAPSAIPSTKGTL